jgi:hypothetical protein
VLNYSYIKHKYFHFDGTQDRSVSILMGYRIFYPGSIPEVEESFFLHSVQTYVGTHPLPFPLVTGDHTSGGEAAREWRWPFSS